MDSLSMNAIVESVLRVCFEVTRELEKFRDAASEAKGLTTAVLTDLSALRQVLQSMQETFDRFEIRDIMTAHVRRHWRDLLTSLQDGHTALEQLEKLTQKCNKDVTVVDQAQRGTRLKEAADSITIFRLQIQSYNATLQLSLQTIALWSSLSIQVSTAQTVPSLAAIHTDIRQLAIKLDTQLKAMQQLSTVDNAETQNRNLTHLKNCVRSAATVLSSASTIVSTYEQDPLHNINDPTSDVWSVWVRYEASQGRKYRTLHKVIESPWIDLSEGQVTVPKHIEKVEDSAVVPAANDTSSSGNNKENLSNMSPENLADSERPGSNTYNSLSDSSSQWWWWNRETDSWSWDREAEMEEEATTEPGDVPTPGIKRRSISQLWNSKLLGGKNRQINIATSEVNKPAKEPRSRKLVFVGDGNCGKTHFLIRLCNGSYQPFNMPTVFDDFYVSASNGKTGFDIIICDTAGMEDYDRLRPISYRGTHIVCLCFAIDNPDSFENVEEKWFSEVLHFWGGRIRFFLLGFKQDLREDEKRIEKLSRQGRKMVNPEQAEALRKKIGAIAYLESSAESEFGVQETFEAILNQLVSAGTESPPKVRKWR